MKSSKNSLLALVMSMTLSACSGEYGFLEGLGSQLSDAQLQEKGIARVDSDLEIYKSIETDQIIYPSWLVRKTMKIAKKHNWESSTFESAEEARSHGISLYKHTYDGIFYLQLVDVASSGMPYFFTKDGKEISYKDFYSMLEGQPIRYLFIYPRSASYIDKYQNIKFEVGDDGNLVPTKTFMTKDIFNRKIEGKQYRRGSAQIVSVQSDGTSEFVYGTDVPEFEKEWRFKDGVLTLFSCDYKNENEVVSDEMFYQFDSETGNLLLGRTDSSLEKSPIYLLGVETLSSGVDVLLLLYGQYLIELTKWEKS